MVNEDTEGEVGFEVKLEEAEERDTRFEGYVGDELASLARSRRPSNKLNLGSKPSKKRKKKVTYFEKVLAVL